jgi:hypothetical protein
VLTLGAYRLMIIISFRSISPFISMECPFLSRLINVGLKSTLSEISVATLACFPQILSSSEILPLASKLLLHWFVRLLVSIIMLLFFCALDGSFQLA